MPCKYNGKAVGTDKGFRKTDGYMTPRNWNTVWDDTEKKNQGLTWEDDPTPTKSDEDKLADLRRERDWRLADTDFYELSDQTLSTDMKNYRQALRDITKSYQSMDAVGFAWPTKTS